MTYPGSSPWGPHGPQVPPNSVTPNPTSASPPPVFTPGPTPAPYSQPLSPTSQGGTTGSPRPAEPKKLLLAVLLAICFGPFGLWYATWGTRQALLSFLFAGAAVLDLLWSRQATWTPFVVISVIWAVFAVRAHNRQLGVP